MMEVDVSGADRFSPANVLRCAARVSPLRAQEGAGAGEQAPTIFGVLAQVALDQRRGFTVLAEMQERPGDVIVPEGRVLVGSDLSQEDRKSTRLNSSHLVISYAVFCLKQ